MPIHHVKPVLHGRRGTGLVPDNKDFRDIRFNAPRGSFSKIAEKKDLRPKMRLIEDQGELGCCVGFGVGACYEFLAEDFEASYLMIYYNARAKENTIKIDNGCMIRNGVKQLSKIGTCSEKIWPYDQQKFSRKPPTTAYKEATRHKVIEYQRVSTLADILVCINNDFPVVFGAQLYESFETEETVNTGVVKVPQKKEINIGGHCMVYCGYDKPSRMLITRNSWDITWGDKGYCYFPFEYVETPDLIQDMWVIKKG